MKYRKLRIVWSVGCGILCLLLIVLWMRSYWLGDRVVHERASGTYEIASFDGNLTMRITRPNNFPDGEFHWAVASRPTIAVYWLSGNEIIIPYWLAAIFLAGITGLPWIRCSTRFSLRSMLIAITLIGLILGLIIATTG
jgi:hypothetical protein